MCDMPVKNSYTNIKYEEDDLRLCRKKSKYKVTFVSYGKTLTEYYCELHKNERLKYHPDSKVELIKND